MRIIDVFSRRLALASAFALFAGCTSVIVLHPNEDGDAGGSGGSGGAVAGAGGGIIDAGPDVPLADADMCVAVDLSDGLIAHYTFDGDADDATGHGLNGIPSGNLTYVDGKIGKAISFLDTDARVTVPEAPELDTYYQFTLAAWVNPVGYPVKTGNNPVIISKVYSADVIGNYVLSVQVTDHGLLDALGVEYHDLGDGGPPGTLVVDGVWVTDDPANLKWIPLNTWTHVAATFDNGTLQLFINGKLVAQKESNVPHTETSHYTPEDVVIGNAYSVHSAYGWMGAMDDVRIYGRPLTATEVGCLAGQ